MFRGGTLMTTDSTTAQRVFAVLLALALSAAACSSGDDGSGDTAADASGESDNGDLAGSGLDVGEGESVAPTIAAPQEEEADEDEIRHGGVLVVAMEAESDGLNPVANNFATPGGTMGRAIFDPLFVMDADGRPVPSLAAGAEPVEGTTSWQIFLREGVMFLDGNEMTADDLLVGFEAQLADPIISLAVAPSFPPENRVERIDDYTVQFNLLRKTAHFPANLASQLGMVPSSEYIAAAAEDETLNQMPIGQGPFRIVSRAQDDRTVVERFDGYWQGSDTVYLDGIEFLPITDTALAAERIAAGDIDMVSTTNPDAILTLRDAAGVDTIENVFSSEGFIMMNTRSAPFDDIRVRQALTYATDRELYASLISQGTSPLADSMFHPSLIWNNPDVVQEGNMPELAGPLVESYCADMPENCTDSRVNMELQYSGPSVVATRIADVLSSDWEPFFNVTEQELLQDAHILEVAIGQFQVVTWGQFGSIEPDNEVVWLECATAEGFITINWVRWCNPDRDALLYEQRAIDDLDRRVEIWREIQAEMNESYAYIFTTHTNWTIGHREEVRGICRQTAPGGELLFCNSGGLVQFNQIWLTDG